MPPSTHQSVRTRESRGLGESSWAGTGCMIFHFHRRLSESRSEDQDTLDSAALDLTARIRRRSARIAVIGLGYVGLPLAEAAAESGFTVVGVDRNRSLVESLGASGPITFTTDESLLKDADIFIICVPTPLKGEIPDTSHIEEAARAIAVHLKSGNLVVLESTSYPGTTEELLLNILDGSGLKAGIDYHLGFSPERVDPGNARFGLKDVPKLIGGINPASTAVMNELYSAIVDTVVEVSSPRVAEMAKLLENTYRHVNIALVNEIAILCHELGIDVWEVIEAASTKPFGFQAFYPGPGWGGHCIPVDPAYLSWRVRQMGATARFVELAREFNEKMPEYVVHRVTEALNERGSSVKGARIFVLGVTYKKDVPDLRESPAIDIIERLRKAGADISFNDPMVDSIQLRGTTLESISMDEGLASANLVLVITDHSSYDWKAVAAKAGLVLDTRNALKGLSGSIVKL